MTLEIVNHTENKLIFLIKNVDVSFVNGIRRAMMSDISGYAFDEIEIKNNTTLFHDEYLKHRIGLIPVKMGNQITFGCDETNNGDSDKYVISDMIDSLDEKVEYEIMKSIPIAVLRKGERLNFVAKTNKGIGKQDIKYSLVSSVNFVKTRRIERSKIVEDIVDYMYKDVYYGREYLLKKNGVEYEDTNIYCMIVNTIMVDSLSVLKITLTQLILRITMMRDYKLIEEIEEDGEYIKFKMRDIDYTEASIFVSMLLKRDDIKIATYKNLKDGIFEFKVEKEVDKDIMKIKEEVMGDAFKIVDKMFKMLSEM